MRGKRTEQLSLLDLPQPEAAPRAPRRRADAAMTARCCNALLAELDRVTSADRSHAEHLLELFEAAERAASAPSTARGRDRRRA